MSPHERGVEKLTCNGGQGQDEARNRDGPPLHAKACWNRLRPQTMRETQQGSGLKPHHHVRWPTGDPEFEWRAPGSSRQSVRQGAMSSCQRCGIDVLPDKKPQRWIRMQRSLLASSAKVQVRPQGPQL